MSKESTPAHFDNMTAEPDIPIALTSGTTAMSEMGELAKSTVAKTSSESKS